MTNYSIDDGNSNQLTAGLQDHDVWAVAQRLANERGESVYVYEDGSDGEPTEIEPESTDDDTVTVEEMPAHLRASHRAARNWGQYPMNGATRREVSREEAEQIVADDADGYDHIVGE